MRQRGISSQRVRRALRLAPPQRVSGHLSELATLRPSDDKGVLGFDPKLFTEIGNNILGKMND